MKLKLIAAMAITGAALAGLPFAGSAHAQQNWPERNVTLIVTQPGGASPDVMARLIADRMSKDLKQAVIIENKPGGGNVVGALAGARAAPDGYTFLFATSATLATNPFMMKALPYDPVKDFAPVALVTRSNQIIVAYPGLAARNLQELIALDHAKPGALSIAVDGPRNLAGVTAQALNKRAGLKLVPVPYPNPNNGVQDVIAGRAQLGVFSVSIVESLIRAGELRPLALATTSRVAAFPDVPAAGETVPGFDFAGWFMVMAPAGTPPAIIERMNGAIDRAAHDPAVLEMAPKLGFEINPKTVGSPKEAATFLQEQLALWSKTTQELGIEPQ